MPGVRVRDQMERVLGHPVSLVLGPSDDGLVVAISRSGDPASIRAAWVHAGDGRVIARIATPPGRPSRYRPIVAAVIALDGPTLPHERAIVAMLAPTASAMRPVTMDDPGAAARVPVTADGLAAARLASDAVVLAADALDDTGEPVGRVVRAGISEMRFDGVSVSGHMRATHGMAAGIGHGHWARSMDDAAFEAGYTPARVRWIPPGLAPGPPRVEPDSAYPAAPPALISRWEAADGARVLLRQAPAPLASPDPGGALARTVRVGEWPAVLRGGGGVVTLVWETHSRAFGLQVRGVVDPGAVALRVADSVTVPPEG